MTATSLPDLARRIAAMREAELREASSFAVTYDGWKGGDEQGKVVGIVYHWLDKQWEPRHAALDLIEASSQQTGTCPCLYSCVLSSLSQRSTCTCFVNSVLDRRLPPGGNSPLLSAIIADNAPNYQGAAKLLSGDNFGCAAHSANLIVKHTVEACLIGLDHAVRALVNFFRRSTLAQEALNHAQRNILPPGEKPLSFIAPAATRWNSVLHMFERYIRLAPAVKVLAKDMARGAVKGVADFSDLLISKENRKKIERALPVLQLLRKFILTVEKYSFTIGELPHLVHNLRVDLRAIDQEDNFTSRVRSTALDLVEKYFGPIFQGPSLPLRAAVFHPHYASLSWVEADVRNQVWEAVARDGLSLYTTSHSHDEEDVIDLDTLSSHLRNLRKSLERNFDANVAKNKPSAQWWKELPATSQHVFLHPLARMYLAIPATSASAESAFSSTGFLLEGRERLTTEHLEMQMIIRDKLIEWRALSAAELGVELEKIWRV